MPRAIIPEHKSRHKSKITNSTFPKFTEDIALINIHKPILVLASGSHFLQVIEIEWRRKKKNLNYITSADQPTDSRPPEATSASSTNIDRILIFFPHFLTNMKPVYKSCFPSAVKKHLKFLTKALLHSLYVSRKCTAQDV